MDAGAPLRVTWHGPVAELVLDRPGAHNALSTDLLTVLAATCSQLAEDPRLRAVVLSSAAPRAFSVGADLKERAASSDEELLAQRPRARAGYAAVHDLPVPTVAAVHGYALGGGFELALSCDLVVADRTAVVGLPEVGVGLVPGGGGMPLLLRRVGYARAADLVLTGRRVGAEEAHELGVVDRLVGAGEAREAALGLAAQVATQSPVAVRAAKRALREAGRQERHEALEAEERAWRAAAFSDDRREGVAAFVERRPPTWRSGR